VILRVRGAVRQNCAEKNIRLAEKYYKFGWDLASRKKKLAAARGAG